MSSSRVLRSVCREKGPQSFFDTFIWKMLAFIWVLLSGEQILCLRTWKLKQMLVGWHGGDGWGWEVRGDRPRYFVSRGCSSSQCVVTGPSLIIFTILLRNRFQAWLYPLYSRLTPLWGKTSSVKLAWDSDAHKQHFGNVYFQESYYKPEMIISCSSRRNSSLWITSAFLQMSHSSVAFRSFYPNV